MSATSDGPIPGDIRDALDRRCAEWLAIAAATSATDRGAVKASVQALYRFLDLAEPIVIFCESPWQMVTTKTVLEKGLTSQTIQSCTQRAGQDSPPGFPATCNSAALLWDRLWFNLNREVAAGIRTRVHAAKMQEEKERPKSSSLLQDVARAFGRGQETEPPPWASTTDYKVRDMQTRASRELDGACAASIGEAKSEELAQIKAQFGAGFAALFNVRADHRRGQIATELTTISAPLITPEFHEEVFNREHAWQFGRSVLQGRLMEEYDRLWPPETREMMTLWIGSLEEAAKLWYAAWTIEWLPFFELLYEKMPSLPFGPTNVKRMRVLLDLARCANCYAFSRDTCFVCERPLVCQLDENGRLHAEDGPAIAYGDGFKIYSWHGTTVPEWIIKRPATITVDKITNEFNAEIRRVLIERYGMSQFLQDSGAVEIDSDECGVLYRKELANDEPLVMVKVRNSTAEPDGTYRNYFLRVPPAIKTAREAVAWTFEMEPAQYKPRRES